MNKTNRIIIGLTVLIVFTMLIVIIAGFTRENVSEVIQGEIEMTEYRVSTKVPSRVKEIRVEEGQMVHAGDTLAIMESPEVDAMKAKAEAAFDAASALQTKVDKGAREEQIRAAKELWIQAQAASSAMSKTFNRMKNLYNEGVISAQKYDEALAAHDAAIARERAAKASYDMAVNGAQAEDKAAAAAQTNIARSTISEVNSFKKETVVTASADGQVSEIFPKIGELVSTGAPIMNVIITTDPWFIFNIREDRLQELKVGAETEVFIPAVNKTIKAKVERVKNAGTFATWKATKSLDKYDLKTFEVKAVPVKAEELNGTCPGMSAIIK